MKYRVRHDEGTFSRSSCRRRVVGACQFARSDLLEHGMDQRQKYLLSHHVVTELDDVQNMCVQFVSHGIFPRGHKQICVKGEAIPFVMTLALTVITRIPQLGFLVLGSAKLFDQKLFGQTESIISDHRRGILMDFGQEWRDDQSGIHATADARDVDGGQNVQSHLRRVGVDEGVEEVF